MRFSIKLLSIFRHFYCFVCVSKFFYIDKFQFAWWCVFLFSEKEKKKKTEKNINYLRTDWLTVNFFFFHVVYSRQKNRRKSLLQIHYITNIWFFLDKRERERGKNVHFQCEWLTYDDRMVLLQIKKFPSHEIGNAWFINLKNC